MQVKAFVSFCPLEYVHLSVYLDIRALLLYISLCFSFIVRALY